MPDLFTGLTAKYVEEHRAGASPAASDSALQWMELQLEGALETGANERYLLESYLSLLNDELQAMPGAVHEWFLERWAMGGAGIDDRERVSQIADRIAAIYLMAGPGTYQAAAIGALLSFDQQGQKEPSHVTRIWDLVTENARSEDRLALLAPLTEALLDLVYMLPDPTLVLRALGDITRRDAETHYTRLLIRERIGIVGEETDGPLKRLLGDHDG